MCGGGQCKGRMTGSSSRFPCWAGLQFARDKLGKAFGVARLAFPDDGAFPPQLFQRGERRAVAFHIAADLGLPVGAIGGRHARAPGAVMTVPEASVDEQRSAAGREDEVRLARQIVPVEAEAQTKRVGGAAHGQLRRRVPRLHRAHHGGAPFGREDVGHQRLFPISTGVSCGTRFLVTFPLVTWRVLWPAQRTAARAARNFTPSATRAESSRTSRPTSAPTARTSNARARRRWPPRRKPRR